MSEARKNIERLHRMASSSVSAVGMPLGMWVGNGDWADLPESARGNFGKQALSNLDEAMEMLAEVREALVAELDGGAA